MSTTLLYSQTAVLATKDDINTSVHHKLAQPIIPKRTTTTTATTVETDDDGADSMHNDLLPIQLAIDVEDKDALDKEINALFGVPVPKKKNYLSPPSPTSHEHKEENEDEVNCNTIPAADSGSCPTASNGELVTTTKKKKSSSFRLASFRSSISSSLSITSNKHRARTITRKSSYLSSRKSSTLSSLSSQHIDISDGEDNTISHIDEHTQRCAVEAAKSKKKYFRSTLPKSLLKVYDSRDCVASFERDEVR